MNFIKKLKPGQSLHVVQQIASFGAGEGFARGLNWGIMALLPLVLSTEEYGRVGMLIPIELLVANVSLMGLDRALLRFYATDESPGRLLRSILAIWAALAWIPVAVALTFYFRGYETFFGIPIAPHLLLLSGIVAIFNLNFMCICIGRAKRNLAVFLRFRLCYIVLKFAFVLLLAKLLGHSLSYVIAVGAAAGTMLVFVVPFLKKNASGSVDHTVVTRVLAFGSPFVFIIISDNIFNYISRFFLETLQDVGIYTFSFTLGNGVFITFAILATYFEPRIYSHGDDKPRCERWLMFYTNACITLASGGGAALLFLYPYITPYFPEYGRALPTISMILASVLLQPPYLQGHYRLTAYKNTKFLASTTFFAACVSLGLNYLLIPPYGIWGAAMALYLSNLLLSVCIVTASILVGRVPLRQLYSLPTYIICGLGSLAPLIWMNNTTIPIAVLLAVSLASAGLLIRDYRSLGERAK